MTDHADLDNSAIADVFEEVSRLLELTGDNPHRVRSYASVARTLGGLEEPVARLLAQGRLTEVRGIGEGTASRVKEWVETGRLAMLEELRAKVPPGVVEMLAVEGLGPKRVREIWQGLGVASLAELEYACLENRLRDLKGFGEKTQENVLKAIAFLARSRGLRLLSTGRQAAARVLSHLEREPSALRLAVAGSVRRMKPTVRDVNLVATAHDGKALLDAFASMTMVAQAVSRTEASAAVVLEDGTPVDLVVVEDAAFFATMLVRTGTKEHVEAVRAAARAKGLRLEETGLYDGAQEAGAGQRVPTPLPLDGEDDLYRRLGLPYFPPELRESADLSHAPPQDLVSMADLKGILHAHSTWSDGAYSVSDMAMRAAREGYRWFVISDHSRAAAYANGLSVERVRAQWAEVDALNAAGTAGVPVLKGIESDILPDGSLDYPDDVLAGFDVVIGSVHSSFKQPRETMTERLVRAVSHPKIHVLGHPTGRLLLGREGYAFDVARVLDACAEHGTAIELNANPHRLDLDESLLQEAVRRGVRIAIDPDAHSLTGIEDVVFGVGAARRGRLRRGDVLTALPIEEFRAWCAARRGEPPPPPFAFRPAEGGAATGGSE